MEVENAPNLPSDIITGSDEVLALKVIGGKKKLVRSILPSLGMGIIGKLIGADLNTVNDQIIPLIGSFKFIITDIIITNASAAPVNAGGLNFTTAAAQGGDYIAYGNVNGNNNLGIYWTPLRVLTDSSKAIMTVRKGNDLDNVNLDTGLTMFLTNPVVQDKIYFSLFEAEGAALTGDIYILGFPIS